MKGFSVKQLGIKRGQHSRKQKGVGWFREERLLDYGNKEGRYWSGWRKNGGCLGLSDSNWIYSDPATHSVTMERILDLLFCKQLVFLDSWLESLKVWAGRGHRNDLVLSFYWTDWGSKRQPWIQARRDCFWTGVSWLGTSETAGRRLYSGDYDSREDPWLQEMASMSQTGFLRTQTK